MLDFREAPSQDGRASSTFAEVADALLARSVDVVRHLIPRGRLNGHEYVTGNLQGDRGESLSINVKSGVFKDFATGEGGGDLISLWGAVRGIANGEAKAEAETWLGIAPLPERRIKPQSEARDDGWWRGIKPVAAWDYLNADGSKFGTVYRFDHPTLKRENGKPVKTIRPWNGREWLAPPPPRPLYRLPAVLEHRGAIVIVEGERKADAIVEAGYCATTCWGGAQAAGQTNWTTLKWRDVVAWPDNDEAGKQWLVMVEALLRKAGASSLRVVR